MERLASNGEPFYLFLTASIIVHITDDCERSYHGLINLNMLKKGDDYIKLNKSFVIFICLFDPFGEGLHFYSFKHVDEMLKLLQVLTGDDRYNVKFSETEKKEDIKMCDVMEKAVAEERINSIKILVSSLEEFGISSEAIIEKVMEKFNFSREEAMKYVNK